MSDEQYDKRMSKAKGIAKNRRRKQKIREARNQGKKKIKFPTTTKILIFIVISICIEMIGFAQIMQWRTGDTMSIGQYLSIGGTLVTSLGVYLLKSTIENVHKYNKGEDGLANNTQNDFNNNDNTQGVG